MQIFEQKYALKHKAVQRIRKKRTHCYKQVATKRVGFVRLRSQIDGFFKSTIKDY